MENTKREFSLDFTKPRHPRGCTQPSLMTPIGNALALSTPELNRMIPPDGNLELTVLTPNGISPFLSQANILPSPLIPTTVNNNDNINNNCNNNGNNNSNSPINGNHNLNQKRSDKSRDLDVEKIEKKRERNRLAAKKCRQRKLETIEDLRKTVTEWEQKYDRLRQEFEKTINMKNKEIEELRKSITEPQRLIRH